MEPWLTEDPQITYFNTVQRRHTAFEIKELPLTLDRVKNDRWETFLPHDVMDMMNGITLAHADPDLDVTEAFQSMQIIFQNKDDFAIEFSLCQILCDELQFEKDSILRNEIGTELSPKFFFNNVGLSLPLISLSRMQIKLIIEAKVRFNVCMHGFKLGDAEEKNRAQQHSREMLVLQRTPFQSMTEFESGVEKNMQWFPRAHLRWGPEFHDRMITFFCCVKQHYGSVDKNIRRMITKSCAEIAGLPTRRFKFTLKNKCLKSLGFIAQNRDGKNLPDTCILSAVVRFDGHIQRMKQGYFKEGLWSFAIKDTTEFLQPSGNVSFPIKEAQIEVVCDSRANRVAMIGRNWNCLRVHAGMGGFVMNE